MINPKCDKCDKDLEEFGALIFSPPLENRNVFKFHVCRECYEKLVDFLTASNTPT